MGDVVSLPISLDSDLSRELIMDCCRFQEGILTEQQVRKKYRFDEAAWEALGNDEWVRKVEEESARRIRDGSAKREKSQKLIVQAPDVLSGILLDNTASPRHRIDSAKTLNDFASNGPGDTAPASDRFIISIVLSADGIPHTEHFNKSIAINADDIPNDTDSMPHLAAIVMKKEDGGGGNAI